MSPVYRHLFRFIGLVTGADGSLSSSGTVTLTRTMYYSSVNLTGSAILNTGNFKIFCSGIFSGSSTASINANGAMAALLSALLLAEVARRLDWES